MRNRASATPGPSRVVCRPPGAGKERERERVDEVVRGDAERRDLLLGRAPDLVGRGGDASDWDVQVRVVLLGIGCSGPRALAVEEVVAQSAEYAVLVHQGRVLPALFTIA